ncbi:MAG: hypothetical protein OXC44_00340 [Proteobacteria bacterium]|nr:hypothetical protein [Pseudomonadota bacterium]
MDGHCLTAYLAKSYPNIAQKRPNNKLTATISANISATISANKNHLG